MSATLNLVLHLAVILGPLLALLSIGPSVSDIKARFRLAAWLAGFAGLCAWFLCGYCGPHPFLTMDGGPMPPDLVLVFTTGAVFTCGAIVAMFVRTAAIAQTA